MLCNNKKLCLFVILVESVLTSLQQKIQTINVSPSHGFPIELGQKLTFRISPDSGSDYEDATISFELGKQKAYRIYRSKCSGPMEMVFVCKHQPLNVIYVSYTPLAEHYGMELVITYFPDSESLWTAQTTPVFKQKVELTKQPSYVNMFMELAEASRHMHHIPTSLRLEPPVFLTGSHVRIDCHSDGALPPKPITFSIECPPPNTAVVEHDRVNQASQGLSYERYYQTYGFYSPPSLADLAPYVGRKHAEEMLRLGHVFKTNQTSLRAVLSLTGKAHDCHVVCRLAGKETRRRLTVYYPTTISYLLPRPRNRQMEVGSEITCYADGHPPPTLSLRLSQPLKPPQPFEKTELEALWRTGRLPDKIEGDLTSKELVLTDSGLEILPDDHRRSSSTSLSGKQGDSVSRADPIAHAGTLHRTPADSRDRRPIGGGGDREPYELADRLPGFGLSTTDKHRMLGIRPWEYTIEGATFRLADNATPGVELLLTCNARNFLPGDTTFLNMNGTIARVRFVVIARSAASIGISLGICAGVLLLVLIVIAVMLSQRKRQAAAQQSNSIGSAVRSGRVGAGLLNGKKAPVYPPEQYQKTPPSPTHTRLVPYSNNENAFPSTGFQQQEQQQELPNSTSLTTMPGTVLASNDNMDYVQLARDRPQSLRGGTASHSMTLYARPLEGPKTSSHHHQKHSGGAFSSVPQNLDYTTTLPAPSRGSVIHPTAHHADVLQPPKAYSSQLVLQQQQEATQTLLAMHRKKPSAFV